MVIGYFPSPFCLLSAVLLFKRRSLHQIKEMVLVQFCKTLILRWGKLRRNGRGSYSELINSTSVSLNQEGLPASCDQLDAVSLQISSLPLGKGNLVIATLGKGDHVPPG